MANEKQTGATATKRATTATPRTPRTTKTVSAEATETAVNTAVPVAEEPASTAKITAAPARKAGVESVATESNAAIDLEAVRRRAYDLYVQRGCLDGLHEQDWYSAEQELSGRKQSRSQNSGTGVDSKRRDSQRSA